MKSCAIILLLMSTVLTTVAQDDVALRITRQLDESRTNFPAMRPQVFFGQDTYAPGDTAFFRLFILTESERILAERSMLTLELIHPNGRTCASQAVSCQRFGAANQLILPDSISPGFYEVRIFSDRMTMAYGLSTPLMVVGEKKLVRQSIGGASEMSVFPEGGHLVTGALNRVVIRANGQPPVSAYLVGEQGRMQPVVFDEAGLADIQFIPQRNEHYAVEYVHNDRAMKTPIPDTEPAGTTVRIYRGPRQTWVIDMATGPKGPRSVTFLLIASRQVLHTQLVTFKSDRSNILAAAGFFPEGYSEIFLVDEESNVLAYRPMYIPARPPAQIAISGLPETAGLRQDISVDLKLVDAEGKPVGAGLAVAIIPEDVRRVPLRTPDPTLELRQVPPTFDWTQPASRIDREILATSIPTRVVPEYPPLLHRSNLTLSGKVYSSDPSRQLPYLSRMVIYLHNDLIQYETAIDGAGNFEFSKIYDFLGDDKVFYKVINLGKQVPHVRVDWNASSSDYEPPVRERYREGDQPDGYGILRKRKRTIDRSFNYFLSRDTATKAVGLLNAELEREFRGPDIVIHPGEYVPFDTMEELIREVIPAVKFRVHGTDSIVQVDLRTFSPLVPQRYAEGNALYVIDGYLTTNTNYLMRLSPKEITTVGVIQDIDKLNRLENLARDGVLFIQTRMPERTRRDLEKELLLVHGISPTLSMPTRYPRQPRVPDLRSQLYWTPLIDADSTGRASFRFRTSDLPGAYWIRVMGTTVTGHLVTAEQRFVVNFK